MIVEPPTEDLFANRESVFRVDIFLYTCLLEGFSEALSRRLVALATLSNDSLLATDLDVGQLKVTMDATNMQGRRGRFIQSIMGSGHLDPGGESR